MTFDAVAHTATVEGDAIVMVSPVDPAYGLRVRRRISLDARAPVLSIETTFEKVQGPPVRVAVWTITQLASPSRMVALSSRSGRRSRAGIAGVMPGGAPEPGASPAGGCRWSATRARRR